MCPLCTCGMKETGKYLSRTKVCAPLSVKVENLSKFGYPFWHNILCSELPLWQPIGDRLPVFRHFIKTAQQIQSMSDGYLFSWMHKVTTRVGKSQRNLQHPAVNPVSTMYSELLIFMRKETVHFVHSYGWDGINVTYLQLRHFRVHSDTIKSSVCFLGPLGFESA